MINKRNIFIFIILIVAVGAAALYRKGRVEDISYKGPQAPASLDIPVEKSNTGGLKIESEASEDYIDDDIVYDPNVKLDIRPEYIEAMRLPEEAEAAVKEYASGFEMWKLDDYKPAEKFNRRYFYSAEQLPNEVRGDFNGDGKTDYVLAGHKDKCSLLLGLISSHDGYEVAPIFDSLYHKDGVEDNFKLFPFLLPKGATVVFQRFEEDGANYKKRTIKIDMLQYSGIRDWKHFFGRSDSSTLSFVPDQCYYFTSDSIKVSSSAYEKSYEDSLKLTDGMKEALYSFNKDFQIWDLKDYDKEDLEGYGYSAFSMPNKVRGDFNKDGKEDFIVSGHDKKGNKIYCISSSPSGYKIIMLTDVSYSWTWFCYEEAEKVGIKLKVRPSEVLQGYGIMDIGSDYKYTRKLPDFKVRRAVLGIRSVLNNAEYIGKGGNGRYVYHDWERVNKENFLQFQPEFKLANFYTIIDIYYKGARL